MILFDLFCALVMVGACSNDVAIFATTAVLSSIGIYSVGRIYGWRNIYKSHMKLWDRILSE